MCNKTQQEGWKRRCRGQKREEGIADAALQHD